MDSIPRRQALKTLGAAGAGALIGVSQADTAHAADAAGAAGGAGAANAADTPIVVGGTSVQVVIEPVSRQTVRISLIPAPSRDEVVGIAKTFREKKLPCDALIYLGTGFTNSGWNVANGTQSFNRRIFTDPKDPKALIDELHAHHFRVVLHTVILARALRGTVNDRCDLSRYDEEEAGCYWNTHRKTFALGVDGWWPDEGDGLNIASRLTRNRMHWEGPQLDRPDERPYALHRNGYAGMQRYASFLWSGDTFSTWETLRVHVPIAINTGLTGIPLWGTDVGGFVPTPEFTGELYVRWFQFGAFCPLFRSHGRTWKLRLPWGWNTGSYEPDELISTYEGAAGNPDVSELRNAAVEPICKQYLELRYRLMPYLYSAIYEGHRTGLPVMRALWLHHPDDRTAVARGDQYLWGRDILVAPVTEKGATSRKVYLPRGKWYDFWTNEPFDGGQDIDRKVDLATCRCMCARARSSRWDRSSNTRMNPSPVLSP